jgi:uncharacterized membrane protein
MTSDRGQGIAKAITEGYNFKTGEYIKRGWEILQKNLGLFIGFFLLAIIINAVLVKIESAQSGLIVVRILINPPLMAGFFIAALKTMKKQSLAFADFFTGFENFVQLNLLNVVASILIAVGLILLIIPGFYLSTAYGLALPIMLDQKIDFWPALESSRKVVTKRWWSFFGFGLLLGLINFLGALCLGFGLLVTVPLTFCAIAAAYEDIIGLKPASF